MEVKNDINFLEYLGAEETNLLTSFHNLRRDFDLFGCVVDLYKAPKGDVPLRHAVVMQLLAFVQSHLFFSTATFLRCHMAEAANSSRSAIDAALIAYRLILGDGTQEEYINGENAFKDTPRYIRNKRKNDPTQFPLAEHLLNIYSEHGRSAAHADIAVFAHRLEVKRINQNSDMLQIGLFQYPGDVDEFRFFFLAHLHTFVVIANVFERFLSVELKAVPDVWGENLRVLGADLERTRNAARAAFESRRRTNN